MVSFKFGQTDRKFTDPVRFFKANDPYYWEVDNIPLKQIHENTKYLKERLDGIDIDTDIRRRDIAELKPYANNSDNIIRIKAGRYTSRINNATDIDRLSSFFQKEGINIGEDLLLSLSGASVLTDLVSRARSTLSINALGLNGLSERAFTYPIFTPDFPINSEDMKTSWPGPNDFTTRGGRLAGRPFPISQLTQWYQYASDFIGADDTTRTDFSKEPGFTGNLQTLEQELIRYWRGTARTAIVDVPQELNVTIPAFDENDFFYLDSATGKKTLIDANSRIDLIFIYSKPVDTSSVEIGKFTGNPKTRTKITAATAGVLLGAGVGLNEHSKSKDNFTYVKGVDSEGRSVMMPSVGDENNTDSGFLSGINQPTGIHGSFPSPEDLLNISPLLSEKLETDSWLLTGQTILPVAYVKINKTATLNKKGAAIITNDDIVDIRPFFRTAELSYNERAGVAAAMPPLSIANAAVGKYQLDYEVNRVYRTLNLRLKNIIRNPDISPVPPGGGDPDPGGGGGKSPSMPRRVATGYVFGGSMYGPEAAMADYFGIRTKTDIRNSAPNRATNKARVRDFYGLKSDVVLPDYPDWDPANAMGLNGRKVGGPNSWTWVVDLFAKSSGGKKYGYVDYECFDENNFGDQRSYFTAGHQPFGGQTIGSGFAPGGYGGERRFSWIQKTIKLDKTDVEWMGDYDVEVSFIGVQSTAYWIDKQRDEFTIFVAQRGGSRNPHDWTQRGQLIPPIWPVGRTRGAENSRNLLDGWPVLNSVLSTAPKRRQNYLGEPAIGIALYPTIQFTVTGYPSDWVGVHTDLTRPGHKIKLV